MTFILCALIIAVVFSFPSLAPVLKGLFAHKYEVVKFNEANATHSNGKQFRTMFWATRYDRRMNALREKFRKWCEVSECNYFYVVKPLSV